MTRNATPVDETAFRSALNASCQVTSDLYALSAPVGGVLVKWRGPRFVMRVKHTGQNWFAVMLRGRLSTVNGIATVGYRTVGWRDLFGWGLSVFFFLIGWFCFKDAVLTNRASCWIGPVDGIGAALIVGLGRHTTRAEGIRMVALVEQAIAASRPTG